MTEAERVLWLRLRNRGVLGAKFRRQVPIGSFVADFACAESRLIVEIDGGQHAVAGGVDAHHSEVLVGHGYTVLRFWNNDVLQNLDGVLATILEALDEGGTGPHPPAQRAGEGPTMSGAGWGPHNNAGP